MPNGAAGLTASWEVHRNARSRFGVFIWVLALVGDIPDSEGCKWGCRKLLIACLPSAAPQVLPSGEEIKLQRNALVVLQLPRGDEQVSWST